MTRFIFIIFSVFLICTPAFGHPINMSAIAMIESSNNPKAVGAAGEIGLYQISNIALEHWNQAHAQGTNLKFNLMNFVSSDRTHTLWDTDYPLKHILKTEDLFDPIVNRMVADWLFDWIHERTGNEIHTIICWNRGYGNWQRWFLNGSKMRKLPKLTREYLKKYEELTGGGDLT